MPIFTPVFAEVGDKEPTLLSIWSIAIVVSVVCFLLCRWRVWLLVVALPLAISLIYSTISWLRDSHEGPAIVRELGPVYVVHAWIAAFIPLLFMAVGLFTRRRPV